MPEYYIGIMCGTSLDSLDMSMCSFGKNNSVKLFKSYKINKTLRDAINACKKQPKHDGLFYKVNNEVTDYINSSLKKFIVLSKVRKIKAIGYPGITIIHNPAQKISKTLGDPSIIAKQSGIKVVADFRLTDMNNGGQGAPLSPYFHEYISLKENKIINFINLGGFANLTYFSKNKLMAYDTGPANYLIDMISKTYFQKDYDKNGSLAKNGIVNDKALLSMLSDKYFYKKPPKSTGFEKFNAKWLKKFITKFRLNKNSLISTVSQLTSVSIADSINSSCLDSPNIFFAGGGSRNLFIKKEILKRTGLTEVKKLPWGLDYKNLESAAFAWFAMKRDMGNVISKGYITGARGSRKLGTIYR